MHPDVRAERMVRARLSLIDSAEALAEKSGSSHVKDKVLAIHAPISGVVDNNDRYVLQMEAIAEAIKAIRAEPSLGPGSSESEGYDFSELVGKDGNDALHDAGYHHPDDIKQAADDDLLTVEGIGPAKVAGLRSAFPKVSEEQ